jgi:hypothetical protein
LISLDNYHFYCFWAQVSFFRFLIDIVWWRGVKFIYGSVEIDIGGNGNRGIVRNLYPLLSWLFLCIPLTRYQITFPCDICFYVYMKFELSTHYCPTNFESQIQGSIMNRSRLNKPIDCLLTANLLIAQAFWKSSYF